MADNPLRLLLIALVAATCGCSSYLPPTQDDEPPPFEFRLGAGDQLAISVWGEKELNQKVRLGPDGMVSFRLIGDVNLGGLTLNEARAELGKRFTGRGFKNPVVSLTLLEMRSHIIHVLGAVDTPGTVAYVRGATVLAAIQAMGGPRPGIADITQVRVIRHRTADPLVYEIDVEQILSGEIRDMWLVPGDTIMVPTRLLTRWSRWWRQALPWGDGVEEPR